MLYFTASIEDNKNNEEVFPFSIVASEAMRNSWFINNCGQNSNCHRYSKNTTCFLSNFSIIITKHETDHRKPSKVPQSYCKINSKNSSISIPAIMKATIVNSLTYFLFVASTSAQKDRIYQAEGGIRQNPGYSELPAELDRGDEDNNVFLLGRSANSNCGGGGHGTLDSLHHYSPCDEDVESNGVDNSNSISTRYDPVVTEAPEAPEGSEGSEDPSDAQETPTDVCISSDGIFGNILDTTALMTLPITYLYEMQTVTGTDQDQINDKILPKLEKFIMDSILPEVFPTKCAATAIGKRRQRRNLQNDGLLEVIGVSMYPPDDITSNCKCTSTVSYSIIISTTVPGLLYAFITSRREQLEETNLYLSYRHSIHHLLFDFRQCHRHRYSYYSL